jgi:hypothetical protein
MKIKLMTPTKSDDPILRHDMQEIQAAINQQQTLMEVDSYTADPAPTAASNKVYIWWRSDLNEIRINENGTLYKIAATAV